MCFILNFCSQGDDGILCLMAGAWVSAIGAVVACTVAVLLTWASVGTCLGCLAAIFLVLLDGGVIIRAQAEIWVLFGALIAAGTAYSWYQVGCWGRGWGVDDRWHREPLLPSGVGSGGWGWGVGGDFTHVRGRNVFALSEQELGSPRTVKLRELPKCACERSRLFERETRAAMSSVTAVLVGRLADHSVGLSRLRFRARLRLLRRRTLMWAHEAQQWEKTA